MDSGKTCCNAAPHSSTQWKYSFAYGITESHASSRTLSTSSAIQNMRQSPPGVEAFRKSTDSRSGPFSRSMRFCSMCFVLDAPISTESPCSRFIRLWCEIQRSAISANVSLYFCATASILASALKWGSFQ